MTEAILIINVGSTSVKTRLFSAELKLLAELSADYGKDNTVSVQGNTLAGQVIAYQLTQMSSVEYALESVLAQWQDWLQQAGLSLLAIGHRVVHGANWYAKPTEITDAVLEQLIQLDAYAPLHNPFNRLGISIARRLFPDCRQFALFDTAFHRTIPDYAGKYALPDDLSPTIEFYRYGFHGLSCVHSVAASSELLNIPISELNLIVLHLGGGASATAICGGVSIDTSMGFSPCEGLMMAKRSGDLDPMILVALQKEGYSAQQIDDVLNHRSGLYGISGHSDMRLLLAAIEQGDERVMLAVKMFCYRIKKYIGAYYAILGRVSALVFTGGIGEHAALVREEIMGGLAHLGMLLDVEKNRLATADNRDISANGSAIKILVIAAAEERVSAQQIFNFLGQ
ncbi:acetate/propionate family kinase [Methylocucumis oryzae]|uniref:Acetate kinase n=1 Tax=Methylocucumis oryzae TaxID=1632867 RepID=A0A0F3IMM6_9GAMM|nr:acetate/propionate family kinase [Methylocucumis oryzae]KJV06814.1 acetate kinase [Methylocucumis oryzae]